MKDDEINNQRERSSVITRDGGTDMDIRKLNHGYDVIVGGELFTDYSDHPRKLVISQNSNQQASDATASFPLVGCLPQAAWPERLL